MKGLNLHNMQRWACFSVSGLLEAPRAPEPGPPASIWKLSAAPPAETEKLQVCSKTTTTKMGGVWWCHGLFIFILGPGMGHQLA